MKRIEVLDLWRSLAVLVMVFYHAVWDLELLGVPLPFGTGGPAMRVLAWLGASSFILISGLCLRFSKNCLKRGFFIFCLGGAVSAVMLCLRMPVFFGILQLLGTCMMLGSLGTRDERRLPGPAWAALGFALFLISVYITQKCTVGVKWLYPLGFKYEGFYSADYYPLLPWGFMFFTGVCLGETVEKRRNSKIFTMTFSKWLTFPGRHSLAIYILHQPLLWGAFTLLSSNWQ